MSEEQERLLLTFEEPSDGDVELVALTSAPPEGRGDSSPVEAACAQQDSAGPSSLLVSNPLFTCTDSVT